MLNYKTTFKRNKKHVGRPLFGPHPDTDTLIQYSDVDTMLQYPAIFSQGYGQQLKQSKKNRRRLCILLAVVIVAAVFVGSNALVYYIAGGFTR